MNEEGRRDCPASGNTTGGVSNQDLGTTEGTWGLWTHLWVCQLRVPEYTETPQGRRLKVASLPAHPLGAGRRAHPRPYYSGACGLGEAERRAVTACWGQQAPSFPLTHFSPSAPLHVFLTPISMWDGGRNKISEAHRLLDPSFTS